MSLEDGTQTFDYTVPIESALLWRYNNAPVLQSLIAAKQSWYDTNQTTFWDDWYTDVFNLATANQFGCVVWSIILGIPLNVILAPTPDKRVFGFKPYGANFFRSNFGTLQQTVQSLTLAQQRLVLQLRYLQLISRGTVPSINANLAYLFGEAYGTAWVIDNHNMTMTYVFNFELPSALLFVFNNYDILPRPAGVSLSIISE
jgi:hypothetical protein